MMQDFHLILFVLVLVLIDVVFITVWIFYDPLEPEDIVFDDLVSFKVPMQRNFTERFLDCIAKII